MSDVVVIGSGPNGLAAAIACAQKGASVLLLEGKPQIGGGLQTQQLTLPGFLHDVCAGAHPMGITSPFFRTLPLDRHGLRWKQSRVSVAHPLDDQPAVLLTRSLQETAAQFGEDAATYSRMMEPLLRNPLDLLDDALGPLGRIPHHPLQMLWFGWLGARSAVTLARRFRGPRARALLAGCAAHSILPLTRAFTGAMGLIFPLVGHVEDWPVAEGGSIAIAQALGSYFQSLRGRIETGVFVRSLADLPPARVYLFDTSPAQLASIAGPVLPEGYLRRIGRFRYGPAVFKVDWALDGPIPWKDERCNQASTVHLGGTLEEIAAAEAAVWQDQHPDKPYVLMVQQSELDPTRAPAGQHTGYAYSHVPAGSTVDFTETIERQIERFAPGFRDRILARHVMRPLDFQQHNPNYIGGAITGGVADLPQLFTRPVARWNPYTTPNPRVFLCSASTPPGGGVHGMCGFHAAQAALKRLDRIPVSPLR